MEEPEEYVVEEELHVIAERVEAEPAEGIQTLKIMLALCVFSLSHSLCSLAVSLLSVSQMLINILCK